MFLGVLFIPAFASNIVTKHVRILVMGRFSDNSLDNLSIFGIIESSRETVVFLVLLF